MSKLLSVKWLRAVAVLSVLAALVCAAPANVKAEESDELTELSFGVIPTESLDRLKETFEPFTKALSEKIGMPIKVYYGSDYAAVIEALKHGKVDFAYLGNKSALEAVDHANAEVFAQEGYADGAPGYWSHIILHKDSPYRTIDEIVENGGELVFGNGDPNSTSGYLVPGYYLWAKRGINPSEHFKEVRHANHEANLYAVANKQVDFATNNSSRVRRFRHNEPELAKDIKVIWQSPLIPSDPICWRKDLSHEIKSRVKAAWLAFGRLGPNAEKEKEILLSMSEGLAPFYNSDNRQLLPIRQLQLVKDKRKVANSEDLSDKQKEKRMAEIDQELADLEAYAEMVQKY